MNDFGIFLAVSGAIVWTGILAACALLGGLWIWERFLEAAAEALYRKERRVLRKPALTPEPDE